MVNRVSGGQTRYKSDDNSPLSKKDEEKYTRLVCLVFSANLFRSYALETIQGLFKAIQSVFVCQNREEKLISAYTHFGIAGAVFCKGYMSFLTVLNPNLPAINNDSRIVGYLMNPVEIMGDGFASIAKKCSLSEYVFNREVTSRLIHLIEVISLAVFSMLSTVTGSLLAVPTILTLGRFQILNEMSYGLFVSSSLCNLIVFICATKIISPGHNIKWPGPN